MQCSNIGITTQTNYTITQVLCVGIKCEIGGGDGWRKGFQLAESAHNFNDVCRLLCCFNALLRDATFVDKFSTPFATHTHTTCEQGIEQIDAHCAFVFFSSAKDDSNTKGSDKNQKKNYAIKLCNTLQRMSLPRLPCVRAFVKKKKTNQLVVSLE